jgi:pimeloyl-ACP methyl ester carboxylesterase
MGPLDQRFDVSDAVDIEGEHAIAAWLFVPETLGPSPTILFCEHGGSGVTKHYWHLDVPGHPGYSFAEHFADRGFIVVATDDLGAGESSRPADSWSLTSYEVAQANRSVALQVRDRLAAGELEGLDAVADPLLVGLSHGRGGMMRIREQAHFGTYDALAIMGYPNQQQSLPEAFWGRPLVPVVAELTNGLRGLDAERALRGLQGNPLAQPSMANRRAMNSLYFLDDVPEAVIEADIAASISQDPGPVTIAGMMVPGVCADDAARIDVPVFSGWCEHDASADARLEPTFFRSSPDVTAQFLPQSGHCQNFASSRVQHWERLALWLDDVAALRAAM